MPLVLKDRVKVTSTTVGTGTFTLGSAEPGYQDFSVVGDGNTTYYTINNLSANQWEVGIGTYTASGTTLSRDTVLESSSGGAKVDFSAGSKDVFVTYPAEKSVNMDASNKVSGYNIENSPIGATTPAAGTFTTVGVSAPTTNATLTNSTGINAWAYSGKSFSVSAQETSPIGVFFKPDGTKMYVTGSSGDDVNEYTLGTAWDVSTASFTAVSTGITQDTAPQDLSFKDDGLTLFVLGGTNDTVYQYALSVAWNITTATYASKSFSVTTQETTPTGMWIKPDGTTMYIVGTAADAVFQYTLSTPWDISTASYASKTYSFSAQETSAGGIALSNDGTKMWITGLIGDDIWEYTLGTAWDISTATPVNNFYVGFQETNPGGIYVDSTAANRVYIVGTTNDTVYQYNTSTNSVTVTTDKLFVDGVTSINGNFVAGANAYVDGAITVQGSLTAASTLSVTSTLTGSAAVTFSTTTSNISIGTSQTTGTLTLGGTSQTGTITVGQSTGAQTLNLGTGATTSGTTKTVNIGTAGVSGSTTNINIGSAVSGATSRTTINGIIIESISAAVSAAGSTQGTATALVSSINNVTVVAASADGVILPTAVAGMRLLIRNSDSADTLKIYPATGAQINALGNNASFSLAAGSTTEIFATTTTQWYTF